MFLEKPKSYRSKKYLGFVRGMPCCVCGAPAEAHHCDTGGKGVKCNDTRAIPLCPVCHQACHAIGKKTFQERRNVDFKDVQIVCLEAFVIAGMEGSLDVDVSECD